MLAKTETIASWQAVLAGSRRGLFFWRGRVRNCAAGSGHMARQPNYDFERRERDRLKTLKTAERAEAKAKATAASAPDVSTPTGDMA